MKRFAFFAFVFLVLSQGAFSKENARKSKFRLVDSYISQHDYNHALTLMEEILRNYPDEFDRVERRMVKIQKRRKKYSKTVAKLIKVIEEEPLNTHAQIVLIEELQKMEVNPGQEEIDFLEFTYANATYAHIFLMLEEIMKRGEEFVRKGEKEILGELPSEVPGSSYETAWQIFCEGFSLNREEFDARQFGERFVRKIDENIRVIRDECLAEFQKHIRTLPPLVDSFVALIEKGKFDEAQDLWPQVSSQMEEFSLLFNKMSKIGELFYDEWQGFLYEDPYYSPMCFIPVAYRIATSKDGGIYTGLLGTVENMWQTLFCKMKRAVNSHLLAHWQTAQSDIPAEGLFAFFNGCEREEKLLPLEKTLTKIGADINSLNGLRIFSRGTQKRNFGGYDRAMDAYKALSESFLANLPNIKNFAFLQSTAPEKIDLEGVLRLDEKTRKLVQAHEKFVDSYDMVAEGAEKVLNGLKKINHDYDTSGEYETALPTAEVEDYVFKVVSQTMEIAEASKHEVWNMALACLDEGAFNEEKIYQDALARAHSYLDGEENPDTGEIYKYPQECLDETNVVLESITDVMQFLADQNTVLSLAPAEVAADKRFSDVRTKNADFGKTLKEIRSEALDLREIAKSQVKKSQDAKKKGDGFFRQAEGFFGGKRFDDARESLQKSREAYNESLAVQQNADFRKDSDAKIQTFLLTVNDEENKFVVTEVRRLYTLANDEFNREEYAEAETHLLQARELWRKTNIVAHGEVEKLLQRVGMALSLQIDRSVPIESPLYPEFSQLMNDANVNFENAQKLMAQKKRDEATALFDEASEKIRAIKLVFPWHKEASLLQLKIQKILDPKAFSKNFAEMFDSASKSYLVKEKQKDAYLTLLDLYEMNPNYPGLKKLIYNVEVVLEIKTPPPDRTAQIKAQKLVSQAKAAENLRDEISVRAAILLLEQAVSLDNGNKEAIRLLDRYRLMIGGQNISVLSAKSESLYQQAVRSLQRNDVVEAVAVLNILLRESDAQMSNKVRDLQERVNLMAQ